LIQILFSKIKQNKSYSVIKSFSYYYYYYYNYTVQKYYLTRFYVLSSNDYDIIIIMNDTRTTVEGGGTKYQNRTFDQLTFIFFFFFAPTTKHNIRDTNARKNKENKKTGELRPTVRSDGRRRNVYYVRHGARRAALLGARTTASAAFAQHAADGAATTKPQTKTMMTV